LLFFFVQSGEAICEKVCSQKNHYRTEPAYHAQVSFLVQNFRILITFAFQVSLRTPAALGKTKMSSQKPKFFKRSSLITEFDLPAASGAEAGQQTVIVREGLV
jgi:hypothetical protein